MKTNKQEYHNIYVGGLEEERKVIEFLRTTYNKYVIKESTKDENKFKDIDCYVGDMSVSIKSEHSGLKYGHVYFELAQCPKHLSDDLDSNVNISREQFDGLIEQGWLKSWYYQSEAKVYVILQKDTLRIYNKSDIVEYVDKNWFARVRCLSQENKQYQLAGNNRYNNSICGFLNISDVRHIALSYSAS